MSIQKVDIRSVLGLYMEMSVKLAAYKNNKQVQPSRHPRARSGRTRVEHFFSLSTAGHTACVISVLRNYLFLIDPTHQRTQVCAPNLKLKKKPLPTFFCFSLLCPFARRFTTCTLHKQTGAQGSNLYQGALPLDRRRPSYTLSTSRGTAELVSVVATYELRRKPRLIGEKG